MKNEKLRTIKVSNGEEISAVVRRVALEMTIERSLVYLVNLVIAIVITHIN